MNAKTAKALRRKIYGDASLRAPRRYGWVKKTGQLRNWPGTPRALYQEAKRHANG